MLADESVIRSDLASVLCGDVFWFILFAINWIFCSFAPICGIIFWFGCIVSRNAMLLFLLRVYLYRYYDFFHLKSLPSLFAILTVCGFIFPLLTSNHYMRAFIILYILVDGIWFYVFHL